MKKKSLILFFLCFSLILIGCNNGRETINNIKFYVDGDLYAQEQISDGNLINEPELPIKSFSYFEGWYTNENKQFDFSDLIYNDINLYATFSINYADMINEITTNLIKANLQVISTTYNKTGILGFQTDVETSYGSGAIFYEQTNKYYLLTNNHVVYNSKSYQELSVKDYLGNTYKATVINNSPQSSYDLAILYFIKVEELAVFSLAKANPEINSEVVAIGQPKLQMNAITLGLIEQYQLAHVQNSEEEINIQFATIRHTAFTAKGSSGGALLNTKLELIGIHYAGQNVTDFSDVCFAVPIEKINEYLNLYFHI